MAMAKYVKKGDKIGQVLADLSANELLKAKLKAKYHLLRDEPLNFNGDPYDKEALLNHVCAILGMERPALDWILKDL